MAPPSFMPAPVRAPGSTPSKAAPSKSSGSKKAPANGGPFLGGNLANYKVAQANPNANLKGDIANLGVVPVPTNLTATAHRQAQDELNAQLATIPSTFAVQDPYKRQQQSIQGLTAALANTIGQQQLYSADLATGAAKAYGATEAANNAAAAGATALAGGAPPAQPPPGSATQAGVLGAFGTSFANEAGLQQNAARMAGQGAVNTSLANMTKALQDRMSARETILAKNPSTYDQLYGALVQSRNAAIASNRDAYLAARGLGEKDAGLFLQGQGQGIQATHDANQDTIGAAAAAAKAKSDAIRAAAADTQASAAYQRAINAGNKTVAQSAASKIRAKAYSGAFSEYLAPGKIQATGRAQQGGAKLTVQSTSGVLGQQGGASVYLDPANYQRWQQAKQQGPKALQAFYTSYGLDPTTVKGDAQPVKAGTPVPTRQDYQTAASNASQYAYQFMVANGIPTANLPYWQQMFSGFIPPA